MATTKVSEIQIVFRSREERVAGGKARCATVPRDAHGVWEPPASRRDPIAILEVSNAGRLSDLIPIRYGRMRRSSFTLLRGSAALPADLR